MRKCILLSLNKYTPAEGRETHLNMPCPVAAQPFIVDATNFCSGCPYSPWNERYMRRKKGIAEECLDALERVTVEYVDWTFRGALSRYCFAHPSGA